MVHSCFDKFRQFATLRSPLRRLTDNTSLAVGLLALAAMLNSNTVCFASSAHANRTASQDITFVRAADQAELDDIRLAALALHKSDDRRVVSFATRIRDVDSQLHLQLSSIANAQHVSFPTVTGAHDKRRLQELALESGSKFNSGYLKSQLRADQQTLPVYQREVAKGDNIHVVAFEKETIPVLDQHIWLARQRIAALAKRAKANRPANRDVRMQTTDGSR